MKDDGELLYRKSYCMPPRARQLGSGCATERLKDRAWNSPGPALACERQRAECIAQRPQRLNLLIDLGYLASGQALGCIAVTNAVKPQQDRDF